VALVLLGAGLMTAWMKQGPTRTGAGAATAETVAGSDTAPGHGGRSAGLMGPMRRQGGSGERDAALVRPHALPPTESPRPTVDSNAAPLDAIDWCKYQPILHALVEARIGGGARTATETNPQTMAALARFLEALGPAFKSTGAKDMSTFMRLPSVQARILLGPLNPESAGATRKAVLDASAEDDHDADDPWAALVSRAEAALTMYRRSLAGAHGDERQRVVQAASSAFFLSHNESWLPVAGATDAAVVGVLRQFYARVYRVKSPPGFLGEIDLIFERWVRSAREGCARVEDELGAAARTVVANPDDALRSVDDPRLIEARLRIRLESARAQAVAEREIVTLYGKSQAERFRAFSPRPILIMAP